MEIIKKVEVKKPKPRSDLVYSVYDLSERRFKWFESKGFLLEDYKSCWFSKDAILDTIYDSGHGPDLEEIPKEWWVGSRFKKEEIDQFEEHWKKNPENRIIWEA